MISSLCFAESGQLGGGGGGGGGGNVIGPVVGTDNAIARFDGDGTHLQNSAVYIGDDRSIGGLSTVSMDNLITFDGIGGGLAITPSAYQFGRDADGTNQLHGNVPTGASFEYSVNDVSQMVLNSSTADFKDNTVKTVGGVDFGNVAAGGCAGDFCSVFNFDHEITDFSGGGQWSIFTEYYSLNPSIDLTGANATFINLHDFETFTPDNTDIDYDSIENFYYYIQMQGAGHIGELVGARNSAIISGTRSADQVYGYIVSTGHFGTSGQITEDTTVEISTPSHGNGGTMLDHTGLEIEDQDYSVNPAWAIKSGGGKVEFGSRVGKDTAFIISDNDISNPFSGLGIGTNWELAVVPISSTAGGAKIIATSDGDSRPLEINGFFGTTNPTDSSAAITLSGAKHDGAGSITTLGNAESVLKVANNTTRSMTILGNGNVSFGVVDPDYSLEVERASGSDSTLALSDGDVVQPATGLFQSDTFFHVGPISSTGGGAAISGISDGDSRGIDIKGYLGTNAPSNATAAIRLIGAKSDGGTSVSDIGSSETLFEVVNNSLGSTFPAIMCTGGRLCAMSSENPSARLDISSNGSDSSTQSFRVTDSGSGNTIFNVRNDSHITIGATGAGQNARLNVNGGNVAGASDKSIEVNATLAAMNGSDSYAGLTVNITNANHTGASNFVRGINIPGIAFDADETASAIEVGSGGWNYGLKLPAGIGVNFGGIDVVDSSGSISIGSPITVSGSGESTFSGPITMNIGSGFGQLTASGSTGGCFMIRDTDGVGWTKCKSLAGALTCTTDGDGVCD